MSLWNDPLRGSAQLLHGTPGEWTEVLLIGLDEEGKRFFICTPTGEHEVVDAGFVRYGWRWNGWKWEDVDSQGIPLAPEEPLGDVAEDG